MVAITIAKLHGKETWQMVAGPEVSVTDQIARFREWKLSETHPVYSAVQLWEEHAGKARTASYKQPAPPPKTTKG